MRRPRREASFDGVEHLGNLDVEQAHALARAAAQVVTLAYAVSRHGHVQRRHRSVARRARRPVDADNRRPDGGGDMCRTRVARQHHGRPARKRDDVAKRLDPQSLAAAKLAIQTFTPEQQPDDAINVAGPAGGWDAASSAAAKPAAAKTTAKPAKQRAAAR